MSDAPKEGLEEDIASGTQADTATAVDDDTVAGPASEAGRTESDVTRESAASGDAAVASAPADDAAEDGAAQPPRRKRGPGGPRRPRKRVYRSGSAETRRPMLILAAAFGVLVVALAAIAIKLGLGLESQQQQQNDQQAVLQSARQAAADLMTVSYQSADSNINRILSMATGSFYSQVSGARKQLVSETETAHAVSKANVLSAGLVGGQVNGNTATVILVVDSTITSKNAPNGVVNHYRETITMSRTHGKWLASQVNFATPSGGQ